MEMRKRIKVFKIFNCVYMLGLYMHVYRSPESSAAVVTGENEPLEVGAGARN